MKTASKRSGKDGLIISACLLKLRVGALALSNFIENCFAAVGQGSLDKY